MLLRGLSFAFGDCPLLLPSGSVTHGACCFTKATQGCEPSHSCSFFSSHPSCGCSCAWGNNWLMWETASYHEQPGELKEHRTTPLHLYMEPHHTSSAGTAATDGSIWSKTFYVLCLKFGGFFLVISCCLPADLPFLSFTVNYTCMNALAYAHAR